MRAFNIFFPLILIIIGFRLLTDLYAGWGSLYTTAYIYFLVLIVSYAVLKNISFKFKTAAILITTSSILSLLALEFVLYNVSPYKTYAEKNGEQRNRITAFDDRMFNSVAKKNERCAHIHRMPPGSNRLVSTSEFSYTHTYNDIGFRENKYVGQSVFFCLGDSFTEGVGTPVDSTWPRLLQDLLKSDSIPTPIMYNAGVAGSDIVFMRKLLEDELLQYRPNGILLALNRSDLHDIMVRGGTERFAENCQLKFRNHPMSYLYLTSYIFRHICHDFLGRDALFLSVEEYKYRQKVAEKIFADQLKAIGEACLKHKVPLHIYFHPFLDESPEIYQSWVSSVIEQQPALLPFIHDIGPTFFFASEKEDLFWPIDRHYNSKGYLLMAESIARNLKRQSIFN
jgi:lysophospholipase L1-like esterase